MASAPQRKNYFSKGCIVTGEGGRFVRDGKPLIFVDRRSPISRERFHRISRHQCH
jgi:hypothetical protein